MKKFFSFSLKSLALAAGLMAATSVKADNVIGQKVTDFTSPDEMKYDWPYDINGTVHEFIRYKVLTFQIDAPAAGTYAVEYLVNTTGNNVQLGATASSDEYIYDEPEWDAFAHTIYTTDAELPTPQNETDEPMEDDGEGEVAEPFVPADPVLMYSPVELQAGKNYVHVFIHAYWRNDYLPSQRVQFSSIRVLPEGSGNWAEVARRASQKAFHVKFFKSMQDETTTQVVSTYEALLKNMQADYTKADTTAMVAQTEAAELKEYDVRHGRGAVISADSTRIDMLLYHNEYNNPSTMAPLGGYAGTGAYEVELGMDDYPEQLEFTRTNYFTYKFTLGENMPTEGTYFLQFLASSANTATIDMTILADDSLTVVAPTYKLSTNNGAWHNYQFFDARNIAKYNLEAGKTYFLHLYYDQYTNVRDILMRYSPKEFHNAEQLEALLEEAQTTLAQYAEGTDGYYAVEDRSLLDNLDEAMAFAYEALGSGDDAVIDEAWEQLNDAILALSNLTLLNILPSTVIDEVTGESSFDVTAIVSNNDCSTKVVNGIKQLDNFRNNGYMIYKIYNKQDAEYQVDFDFGHNSSGAQMHFQFYVPDDNDPDIHFITADHITDPYEGTGGWQNFEPKHEVIGAVPEGYVYLKISGTGPSYVGNMQRFIFTPIPGTEGKGAIALEEGKKAYYAQFSVESITALVQQLKEAIAPYTAGGAYAELVINQETVTACQEAIALGEAAISSQDGQQLKEAYYILTDAVSLAATVRLMNRLPMSENTYFDLDGYSDIKNVKIATTGGFKQLDSFKNNGAVVYKILNSTDCEYEVSFEYGNQNAGAYLVFETYVMNDTDSIQYVMSHCETPEEDGGDGGYAATGGWQSFVQKEGQKVGAMPVGIVYLRISGGELSPTYVGNMQKFVFNPIAGTEGNGAKALAEAMEAYLQGIDEVRHADNCINDAVFTLSGMRLAGGKASLSKGIYIIGGKKLVVK